MPAAVGAQIGRPDATVVAVDGDGGSQMNVQERAVDLSLPDLTALVAAYQIPAPRCDRPDEVAGTFAAVLTASTAHFGWIWSSSSAVSLDCYPMVPADVANEAIITGPGHTACPPAGGRADVG